MYERAKPRSLWPGTFARNSFNLNAGSVASGRFHPISSEKYIEAWCQPSCEGRFTSCFPAVVRLDALGVVSLIVFGQDFFLAKAETGFDLQSKLCRIPPDN